jgi:hypothetical protein
MRVIVQAGHSALFAPYRPNGGGAPGEAAWTAALAPLIAARLRAHGVTVSIVGSWLSGTTEYPAPPAVKQVADLFVGLHYDAPTKHNGEWDDSGGFVDFSPNDPMLTWCERFLRIWNRLYPQRTGIGLDEYRGLNNPNTDRYYVWRSLAAATPAVLIEHGCGSPVPVGEYPAGGDRVLLHEHIDVVAAADADAILEYLGLAQFTQPEDIDAGEEVDAGAQGAPDVTLEQQLILDAAARQGLDPAGIDNLNGINTELGRQVNTLQWLLSLSQKETKERDEAIAQLQQQLADTAPPPAASVTEVRVRLSDNREEVLVR